MRWWVLYTYDIRYRFRSNTISGITDSETNVKYPLADFALTPDVAIIDPQFVMHVPKSVTANTGMEYL